MVGCDSAVATGWTVQRSYPGGSKFFPSRPDLYDGYRISFMGVKPPECGVDHPLPSRAEVKERVQLYHFSPSGLSWSVTG